MHFPTIRAACAATAMLALTARSFSAQGAPDDDRVQRLEQRFDEMTREHQAELAQRDREIAELKARLDALNPPPTTRPAANAASSLLDEIDNAGKPLTAASAATPDTLDRVRNAAAVDASSRAPFAQRTPVSFNPDLAVVSDFVGSYSSNRSNNALNRFDVREVELDLRAAVHPNADGVAILAFERDVANPVFPDPNGGEDEGVDSGVSVEEAYLGFHDFGVPNLTAKLGRFHVRFGRQNILHLHDLPTTDPPLVNQAFLAPEAYADAGLSLSYVVPPRFVGNQYVEVIGEVLAGEGSDSESPTLRGGIDVDSPATNLHVLWNHDLTRDWNFELGGTWLHGHANSDNANDVDLFGGDVTLIHTDPTGGFFNQLFQAEAIYGDTTADDGGNQHAWGAYVLAQQQLNRDYYVGLRFDYTQDPNSDDDEAWAINPYVSFYWSEFLRLRLQYQHKDGDVPSEDNVFFQATWIFGAHPPHPYWAMR